MNELYKAIIYCTKYIQMENAMDWHEYVSTATYNGVSTTA